jgi:hypothetical protein
MRRTQLILWDQSPWKVRLAKPASSLWLISPLSDDVDINTLLKANPKTKTEWQTLARQISTVLFQRLHSKPLYDEFAVEIAKQAAAPLNDRDVRKIGTAMTVLSNEKQKEAKASVGGKKKVRNPRFRFLPFEQYTDAICPPYTEGRQACLGCREGRLCKVRLVYCRISFL